MYTINGLLYPQTPQAPIPLPEHIPGIIDYIPQDQINQMSSSDKGRFERWINANPQFKKYGKQAFQLFMNWAANRNKNDSYNASSTNSSHIPSTGDSPTINQTKPTGPKSNTTRNILIGAGALLLVVGGIALDQKNKKG